MQTQPATITRSLIEADTYALTVFSLRGMLVVASAKDLSELLAEVPDWADEGRLSVIAVDKWGPEHVYCTGRTLFQIETYD